MATPAQPALVPPLVLPLSFATPLAQQEPVSSQQRGASPFATRSTTPRFALVDMDVAVLVQRPDIEAIVTISRLRTGQLSRSRSHMFVSTTPWRRSSLWRPDPQDVRGS